MKPKSVYLFLCVLGTVLPYWFFLPWVAQHGLDFSFFFQQLFANPIGAFFGMDVIVSAIVLLVFALHEGRRPGLRLWWLPLIATCVVGVSLGLPLFLYLREANLERPHPA